MKKILLALLIAAPVMREYAGELTSPAVVDQVSQQVAPEDSVNVFQSVAQSPAVEGKELNVSPAQQHSEIASTIPTKPIQESEPTTCKRETLDLELTPPECVPSSLDTTDIDAQGNWVIKRAFWEQAEKAYEKIMKVNNVLYEQQVQFVQARGDADKLSDKALRELGFEQGQIKEFIDGLIVSVKQQREQKGDLNDAARKLLQELKERQHELEQLSLRLKALDDLSDVLDKVIKTMAEQVTICRSYEKQAWANFKKIGRELNDKKARVMFYEIDGFLKNAQQTSDYVTQTLWQYLQTTVAQISKVLEELKGAAIRLKARGLDIGKEIEEHVIAQKSKELLEKQSQTQAALDKVQHEADECKKTLAEGMWGKVKRFSTTAWQAATDTFTSSWMWFKGLFA